jgi:hypothetical protein
MCCGSGRIQPENPMSQHDYVIADIGLADFGRKEIEHC